MASSKDDSKIAKRHDWSVFMAALIEFGKQRGHYNVPLRFNRIPVNGDSGDSIKLGTWLACQRREYLNGKLKPERYDVLQKMVESGKLPWDPSNISKSSDQTWPFMFECLSAYCAEQSRKYGGAPVKSIPEVLKWKHPSGVEVGLGRWMHTQNKQRRGMKLRPDRLKSIESLIAEGIFAWPSVRNGSSLKNKQKNEDDQPDVADVLVSVSSSSRAGTKRPRVQAQSGPTGSRTSNRQREKDSAQNKTETEASEDRYAPFATMPYARELASKYFTTTAEISPTGLQVEMIYPLPTFMMVANIDTSTEVPSTKSELVIDRIEPVPQVIQVNIPQGSTGMERNVKTQLESQLAAHLCMKMRASQTNEFCKQLANAMAKLSCEC